MSIDSRKLAGHLQELFTTTAEELNQNHQWIRRQRKLSLTGWVRLLVFGWLGFPRRCFADFAERADLSPQALQQRMTPQAVDFFYALLQKALAIVLTHLTNGDCVACSVGYSHCRDSA